MLYKTTDSLQETKLFLNKRKLLVYFDMLPRRQTVLTVFQMGFSDGTGFKIQKQIFETTSVAVQFQVSCKAFADGYATTTVYRQYVTNLAPYDGTCVLTGADNNGGHNSFYYRSIWMIRQSYEAKRAVFLTI